MTERTALIVGAGIGGLATGLALGRAGWQVRVFERAAHPRELGFALMLAPNAIAALRELGLADAVTAEGHVVARAELRTDGGRVLKRFNVGSAFDRTRSVVVLRSALHGILLNAMRSGSLVLGNEAVGFECRPGKVSVELKDGRSEAGDILVGADGVGSVVRKLLHPGETAPRASGYIGVRGVAYGVAEMLGDLSAVGYFAHGTEAATARAGRDAVYWYMSLLIEDVSSESRDVDALLRSHAAVLDDEFRSIVRATKPDDLRLDELLVRDPLDQWGRGPVTLLGDAAHPMLPHTGQGAAQAIEDAVALSLALARGTETESSLRTYESVRSRRTAVLVRRGRRIASITTTKNPVIGWTRSVAIRLVPARAVAATFLLPDKDPHRALRRHS